MTDLGFGLQQTLLLASQSQNGKTLEDVRNEKILKDADETAKDFEAVFVSEMLKPMFEGIEADSPFNGGPGEEVFKSFMIQEYGKIMSKSGALGIADDVKKLLIKTQGLEDIADAQENGADEKLAQLEPSSGEAADLGLIAAQLNNIEPGAGTNGKAHAGVAGDSLQVSSFGGEDAGAYDGAKQFAKLLNDLTIGE